MTTSTPAVSGWFTTGDEPRLLASRCTSCGNLVFPPTSPFEPFALAAVELPEGLVVLGQVAAGYGVADLAVGAEVELVIETLYKDDTGERAIWRWKPVVELGEEADQWARQ